MSCGLAAVANVYRAEGVYSDGRHKAVGTLNKQMEHVYSLVNCTSQELHPCYCVGYAVGDIVLLLSVLGKLISRMYGRCTNIFLCREVK
jgi:hypothetical protein